MKPPVIATHPEVMAAAEEQVERVQAVANNNVSAGDGEAILKATFPDIDDEMIKTFYEMSGRDVKKTKQLINQQLGVFTEEAEDIGNGVDPNDVEFNLLTGQMDPNAISEEERKMIEQALRESQPQENPIPNGVHAVNRRQINQASNNIQQQVEQHLPDEQVVGDISSLGGRKKNAKLQEKVKKGGNQC